VPRHVADSAKLLAPVVSHYLYISTISVYDISPAPITEESPLATMEDETVEEVTNETYGPMKALCEQRVTAELGADRTTILRPTYICGPGDRTDRYTYWPVRTMRGGEMLWPGTPQDDIQIIDVRDLANFTVDCLEQKISGIFNTVTPLRSFKLGELLEDSLAVTDADMTPVWVDKDFIAENKVPHLRWSTAAARRRPDSGIARPGKPRATRSAGGRPYRLIAGTNCAPD
jgi:2'-hydroxyisoflavone reductase